MGFISRKVLPACGSMCVCCPALRPSSRRPVKRYKKLLADVFPKATGGSPNERKIVKLCEYAAKNPFRIPKIAKFLEQRTYKELRSQHINSIQVITETYSKLLYICKEQMAYYANSLLNVIVELLDDKRQEQLQILGCQTLTKFIYNQVDSTYTRNIENFVPKVCIIARRNGVEPKICLRASALQCLSAMIWFMTAYSHIFVDFNEIIYAALDNYGKDEHAGDGEISNGSHHHWVDEVVRCETRGAASVKSNGSTANVALILQPELKDPSNLTREENGKPEVWARICIQKMAELARESTTLRRLLEPMFLYFDCGKHWNSRHGLALVVLSDMSYLVKSSGNEQLLLASVIRHLDHKNVVCDPQTKSEIIRIGTSLVMQLRSRAVVIEIGVAIDLCRHLRKSLQGQLESVGPDETNWNLSLQYAIEDCLLEIAKGIGDAYPLFDMISMALEKLPTIPSVARATVESLLILAHIINVANTKMNSQVFPEALLLQLVKTMMHQDRDTRILAHQLFSVILVQKPHCSMHQSELFHGATDEKSTSVFASATALLEKLRREKGSQNADKNVKDDYNDTKERSVSEEKQIPSVQRSFPNNICSRGTIFDRIRPSRIQGDSEENSVMLTEDQVAQLLSAFWIQMHQPDNQPPNFEAVAHSLRLTVNGSCSKKANSGVFIRFFKLCLSLIFASLESNDTMSASCRRSMCMVATAMLAFAGKVNQIPGLADSATCLLSCGDDPFLGIGDNLQIYVKPHVDMKEYGTDADQHEAEYLLSAIRKMMGEMEHDIRASIVQYLSETMNVENDELVKQLNESFNPEEGPLLSPNQVLDWESIRALAVCEESLSLDEDYSRNSSVIDGDLISESPITGMQHFTSGFPTESSLQHVISVGKLLESALQVAGQVAGTSASTSPLPYGAITTQCEALGMGKRKKLSSWLGSDLDALPEDFPLELETGKEAELFKVNNYGLIRQDESVGTEPWTGLRLPPASPFDNFLKAARC